MPNHQRKTKGENAQPIVAGNTLKLFGDQLVVNAGHAKVPVQHVEPENPAFHNDAPCSGACGVNSL